MTSSELKQAARYALKDNFFQKMLLMIVPLLLAIFSSRATNSSSINLQHQLNDANIDFSGNSDALSNVDWGLVLSIAIPIIAFAMITSFIVMIIATVFKTASMFNYLEIFRGEKEEINLSSDILRTFKENSFWKIVSLTVVTHLIMFLLFFIPVVGWAIAIYLGLSWSQATYVLYDKLQNNNYKGVWDVLNTSSQMMTGYKFKYFVFNLTFIGWYILGALFFGLPQIWTMPYTEMSMVAFYEARIEERL
ncbi:MAG: DUF975 family protein, partial [Pseudolactococcus laudensis]